MRGKPFFQMLVMARSTLNRLANRRQAFTSRNRFRRGYRIRKPKNKSQSARALSLLGRQKTLWTRSRPKSSRDLAARRQRGGRHLSRLKPRKPKKTQIQRKITF